MKESLYVLLCWFVLIDASLLLSYWLVLALSRAKSKLLSLFVISDNIGVEKTDKL